MLAKQKPSKLNVIVYYLVAHETQTRFLMMSFYEQEMKLVRGDLKGKKKLMKGPNSSVQKWQLINGGDGGNGDM